jgi:phage shock protein PspC (stress-responsive transcriptional regulator)
MKPSGGILVLQRMTTMQPNKPLRQSRHDAMLGGVCAGIANWLGWDPTLVRVLYVVLSVVSAAFPGMLVYILLWFIMPEEGF